MNFVLALHSHLPWVLNHGRWPHGSDWLCEAALDTYLPLVEELRRLEAAEVPAPLTIGITPVLANQLVHPSFRAEMAYFLEERLAACRRAPDELAASGDAHLVPLAGFWLERLERLRALFDALGGDLVAEFRRLEERQRLEVIGSAATHGYLPLLGRDESIRLQLLVGVGEHERLFGRSPRGCWVPECAYRPRGPWRPTARHPGSERAGVDEHLAAAGFRFFFADAHLAAAGQPLGVYHDVPLGAERFDAERHDPDEATTVPVRRTPYRAYLISRETGPPVYAFIRDPRSSMQVWSRHHGYPGDEWYLEFHKIRWPGGLKLWRVTGPELDLGAKQPYDAPRAMERADGHAAHFVSVLGESREGNVVVAPFDTELFGHWWFEGVHFLGAVYRNLHRTAPQIQPVTASQHLRAHRRAYRIRLAEGSWGAHGDHHMWMNAGTAWTWERLWPLEDAFWDLAPAALERPWARPVLAHAARQLLLAQASDWQFIISTGAVTDYAERRLRLHCDDLGTLLAALGPDATDSQRDAAIALARALGGRDDLFPNVLKTVQAVVGVESPIRASRV